MLQLQRISSSKAILRLRAWVLDVIREDLSKGTLHYRKSVRQVKARLMFAGSRETQKLQRTFYALKPRMERMENWRADLAAKRQKTGVPAKGPMAIRF